MARNPALQMTLEDLLHVADALPDLIRASQKLVECNPHQHLHMEPKENEDMFDEAQAYARKALKKLEGK